MAKLFTEKGHYYWRFPVNVFMWIYFFIFISLFQKKQKHPPEMFYEKKVFLKILQISQENPGVGVSF